MNACYIHCWGLDAQSSVRSSQLSSQARHHSVSSFLQMDLLLYAGCLLHCPLPYNSTDQDYAFVWSVIVRLRQHTASAWRPFVRKKEAPFRHALSWKAQSTVRTASIMNKIWWLLFPLSWQPTLHCVNVQFAAWRAIYREQQGTSYFGLCYQLAQRCSVPAMLCRAWTLSLSD